MTRFSSFVNKNTSDFWREHFRPRDLFKVAAHIQSVLSSRLDMKLLEAYDILNMPEHAVGSTRTWIPLFLKDERFLGSDQDYKWQYTIKQDVNADSNWLYIDAIYDKHVDPDYCYQNTIDFKQEGNTIVFVNRVPSDIPLYIAKGRYATRRIQHEIGTLLGYERKDSLFYRDSIEPVLASFYKGPTYTNILALLNILFGLPVAKYGNETVQSIYGNIVVTDKYSYVLNDAVVTVKKGDVLSKFQPLCDAVSLITHKNSPYWWRSRPLDLFSKYLIDVPMTEERREYIMGTYLYDVVLSVQVDLAKAGVDKFKENSDLLALFYDALPTRTDVFIGQSYSTESYDKTVITDDGLFDYDLGNITIPKDDNSGIRLHINTTYGLKDYGDFSVYSPHLGRPQFTSYIGNYDYTGSLALTLNDYHWHIYDKDDTDNYNEFWKVAPNTTPIFEPTYSKVFCRLTVDSPWPHKEEEISDLDLATTADFTKEDVGIDMGGYFSDIGAALGDSSGLLDSTVPPISVESNILCNDTVMSSWSYDRSDIEHSRDGLISKSNNVSEIVTEAFYLGKIPKDVAVYTTYSVTNESYVELFYSTDKVTWTLLDDTSKGLVYNKIENIYFKYVMHPTLLDKPEITNVNILITPAKKA